MLREASSQASPAAADAGVVAPASGKHPVVRRSPQSALTLAPERLDVAPPKTPQSPSVVETRFLADPASF